MRIPSGKTDQKIIFVAFDSTDAAGLTLKTGLSSFTVYRMRNGGTPTIYTTPTISEVDATNMPGVYTLLIDEDTTIASGSDSEEMVLRITATGMYATTRDVELYRRDTTTGNQLLVDASGRVDVIKIAGTTQTARDIGASVLLSTGTGTGQLDFTAGVVKSNEVQILGTAVSTPATAGILDVNIKNIANAVVNTASAQLGVNVVNAGATAWNSGAIKTTSFTAGAIDAAAIAADAIGASELAADAATEIGTAVWATAARTLTANTNFNDPTAATIAAAVWDLDATAHQTQGTFGQVLGDSGADTDSVWGLVNTNLDAAVSSRLATAGYTTPPTANANADALLDRAAGVETGVTPRQAWRIVLAACAGKASGLDTLAPVYRDTNDTKDRISATTDASGNRTAVTLDAS